mmetsp:Transcript_4730/g.11135  ORF Transcript_4730/g.11135 Transcript_4730/m.11135 type:complete len:242 (-) Transcript_4730:646-1371(-)
MVRVGGPHEDVHPELRDADLSGHEFRQLEHGGHVVLVSKEPFEPFLPRRIVQNLTTKPIRIPLDLPVSQDEHFVVVKEGQVRSAPQHLDLCFERFVKEPELIAERPLKLLLDHYAGLDAVEELVHVVTPRPPVVPRPLGDLRLDPSLDVLDALPVCVGADTDPQRAIVGALRQMARLHVDRALAPVAAVIERDGLDGSKCRVRVREDTVDGDVRDVLRLEEVVHETFVFLNEEVVHILALE